MTILNLTGTNLVKAYLLANSDLSKTQSAKLLGVDLSRLGQYRRGDRPIPDHIQKTMRQSVLRHAFSKMISHEKLSIEELNILADALTPPALRVSRRMDTISGAKSLNPTT